MNKLHGPHLLRDYYRDLQTYRADTARLDNSAEDGDPRPDRVDLGDQRSVLLPDGVALWECAANGEPTLLVWLRGRQVGSEFVMDQQGFTRDRDGCSAFPLHLEGPGDTPFDPPDAQRISAEQFQTEIEAWNLTWEGSSGAGNAGGRDETRRSHGRDRHS